MRAGYILLLLFLGVQLAGYGQEKQIQQNYTQYVDPFIGTHKMGHTFPGAAAPFGLVQLSPETNNPPMYIDGKYNPEVYKYCAGYQYADSVIIGFAHTHFSGTGHSDLGDFLIMPFTGSFTPDQVREDDTKLYQSTFSHENEIAKPGYYSVHLKESDVLAEFTASPRVGFHKYLFPQDRDTAHIMLDMIHNIYNFEGKNVWTFIRVENDSLITGYRQTRGWARTRTMYFAIAFSRPFISYGHKKFDKAPYNGFYRKFDESHNFPEMAGEKIKAWFDFALNDDPELEVKLALSPVSADGALANLQEEIPHWDFAKTKREANLAWNRELSKIQVQSMTPADKTIFYTAMYHTMLSPVIFEDADDSYRGLDQNIHQSEGFTNYSIFSLWDTFRALHPLYNLIQPDRNADFINSMLAHHDQSVHQMLPIWSHYANENWCMIGYHSVSVIADALVKGNRGFDAERALQACINSSTVTYFDGTGDYIEYGYVPADKNSSSVSKTLEYAYDDWTIAQLAKEIGREDVYQDYLDRSESYRKHYDAVSGFMRPKLEDGRFVENFNPLNTHGQGFIEGNAWTYSLFVPHQPEELIKMMGGDKRFTDHLDSLFTMELGDEYIQHTEDITRDGIIGNYVHGNEPGHHIPYLYNWTDSPWKTMERVRMIMESMYGTGPDGLCGNDDAGQMSAWYIFSALGFYPVCPGSDEYALGSPIVKEALIQLPGGKKLKIKAVNQGNDKPYVSKAMLNGKEIETGFIKHTDLSKGGELVFYMSEYPDKKKH